MDKINQKYFGKHILVGLTYLNKDKSVREQIQIHGIITKILENSLVFKRADNNEDFSIPFDKNEGLEEEKESEAVYELASTSELVENVDFISSWIIHPPEDENL